MNLLLTGVSLGPSCSQLGAERYQVQQDQDDEQQTERDAGDNSLNGHLRSDVAK